IPNVAVGESDAAQPFAVPFFDAPGRGRQFDRKIEHCTLALVQPRHAIIHDKMFAEEGIARVLPDGGAMGGEAVVAAVLRRYRYRNHLALELRETGLPEHQVV